MKLFGSFGSKSRYAITYLVFLAPKAFEVAPSNFIHRICRIVSLPCSVRRKWRFKHTSVAQVRGCLVILPRNVSQSALASPRSNPLICLTCLAANLSTCTPHPWRKQFANSKMARTSSPLAAPPFFIPAWSASSSIEAAFDAAAERYVTASVGFGVMPQPCLMNVRTASTVGGQQRHKNALIRVVRAAWEEAN